MVKIILEAQNGMFWAVLTYRFEKRTEEDILPWN